MDRGTFNEYCRQFNTSQDKSCVFDRFYDPEATFEHPLKGNFKGKAAIVGFWTQGHKGIHEVLAPVNVLIDGDRIAAEFRIEWHCFEDTEYLGARKKGEVYYADCAAFYHLRDNKFIRAKLYLKEV
jgi:hypothetical protein